MDTTDESAAASAQGAAPQKEEPLLRYAYVIFAAVALLLPVFFIPAMSLALAKAAFAFVGVFSAALVLAIASFRAKTVSYPKSFLFFVVWLLPAVALVSALFSGRPGAFFGEGFELDTVFVLSLLAAAFTLAALLFDARKKILTFYGIFLLLGIALALFQIARLILGADVLSLGTLAGPLGNLLGKWNDLGIFFGLLAVLSLVLLEGLPQRLFRGISFAALLLSLFFLSLVNFSALWVLLGGFALFLLLRRAPPLRRLLARAGLAGESSPFPVAPLLTLLLAALLLFPNLGAANRLNVFFGTSQLEARPSLGSTLRVAAEIYAKGDSLLGSGPNTFSSSWLLYRPADVTLTPFWNVDFATGFGYIPTAFATGGILGGLLWAALFVSFIVEGLNALRGISSETGRLLAQLNFFGALFLFFTLFFYTPSLPLLVLFFVFLGITLALSRLHGARPFGEVPFGFTKNSAVGTTALLLLAAISVGGLYMSLTRIAGASFAQAAASARARGDVPSALLRIGAAKTLAPTDRVYRLAVDIDVAALAKTASDTTLPLDRARAQFQKELNAAIADAAKATEANPHHYANFLSRGSLYAELVPLKIAGAYENARDNYQKAAELNPQNPAIPLVLARLELLNGNEQGANDYVAKSLALKGNFTEAVYFLSQLEIAKGNTAAAIEATEGALALRGNDPTLFFQLGFLRYGAKKYQGAAEAFERALLLSPSYANARYFLGLSFYELSRRRDALAQFEELARTNPDNEEVKSIIANLSKGRAPFAPPNEQVSPEKRKAPPLSEERQ